MIFSRSWIFFSIVSSIFYDYIVVLDDFCSVFIPILVFNLVFFIYFLEDLAPSPSDLLSKGFKRIGL